MCTINENIRDVILWKNLWKYLYIIESIKSNPIVCSLKWVYLCRNYKAITIINRSYNKNLHKFEPSSTTIKLDLARLRGSLKTAIPPQNSLPNFHTQFELNKNITHINTISPTKLYTNFHHRKPKLTPIQTNAPSATSFTIRVPETTPSSN